VLEVGEKNIGLCFRQLFSCAISEVW